MNYSLSASWKIRIKSLSESLQQFSLNGSIKAIAHKLAVVADQGKFVDKKVLLDSLETISRNLHVKHTCYHGYKASVKEFYKVIHILGGPRLASLSGPCIDSIYKWRCPEYPSLDCALTDENMEQLAKIYGALMEKHSIAKIPVLTAEAETAIRKVITFDQKREV